MLDTLQRHAIQVLRRAGHTLDEISTLTAVGKRSGRRVSAKPMISESGVGTPGARSIGRPSKAEAYRTRVIGWVTEDPALQSVQLLRRVKLAGYDGAKRARYELVPAKRPSTPRPVVRLEGLAGKFTQ